VRLRKKGRDPRQSPLSRPKSNKDSGNSAPSSSSFKKKKILFKKRSRWDIFNCLEAIHTSEIVGFYFDETDGTDEVVVIVHQPVAGSSYNSQVCQLSISNQTIMESRSGYELAFTSSSESTPSRLGRYKTAAVSSDGAQCSDVGR
jgi:hypothetical protein